MEFETFLSLGAYFALMVGIGLYAYRKSTSDVSDYMLGGRRLGPAVTALSAGASDMSGWMLVGLPGALFFTGLPAAWIAVGLLIGALINYLTVAPRLRVYTEVAGDALTLPDFLEKRFEDRTHLLRVLASLVIVLFFTVYTAATLTAGGKLFESAFGQSYILGLWITAVVVMVYTFIGGFLAVSLTDFVQGTIMFIALIIVPVVAFTSLGDGANIGDIVTSMDPAFMAQIAPKDGAPFDGASLDLLQGASFIGVISAMAWGLGYFGQPHILVRFMAIRSHKDIPMARHIGMSWMLVTLIGACGTGLIGLAYLAQNGVPEGYLGQDGLFDAETIFIVLSQVLFHPLVAGFLLAAILAAIMSTVSSQLLVASSSLTEDFYRLFLRRAAGQGELVMVGRIAVVAVALIAVLIAYDRNSSVLSLVANAWAGFGAAFGPVIILALHWKRMTAAGAFAGMLVGAGTIIVWSHTNLVPAPLSDIYSIVPGFIFCWLTIYLVSRVTMPSEAMAATHARVDEVIAAK